MTAMGKLGMPVVLRGWVYHHAPLKLLDLSPRLKETALTKAITSSNHVATQFVF